MPAVNHITVVHVAPGRFDEFLKRSSKLKKVRERAGAKVRYYRTVAGGLPAVAVVAETSGWKAHGEYICFRNHDLSWLKRARYSRNHFHVRASAYRSKWTH
jgi:hypothetical protein